MATKIQVRRDAAADWTSTNPTLAAGEIGFESDTNKFKIGDGATAWTSLAYAPQDYITGSSTTTFTNKTFDANGTGNSISNIETADIAAGTLVTAAEGIGSNNNDTTIPTSAAVKAYADSVGGGSGTITALNNQAENRLVSIGATTTELDGEANLTFDGSTLTLTGSAALDGVTIADNLITTNRSNDDLELSGNGTGRVQIAGNGTFATGIGSGERNVLYHKNHAQTFGSRSYANLIEQDIKIDSGELDSSNTNDRYRNIMNVNLDLNGKDSTASSTFITRGPNNFVSVQPSNSGTGDSILGNAAANNNFIFASTSNTGDLTISLMASNTASVEMSANTGSTVTFTDARVYNSNAEAYNGGGTENIGTLYHFKANAAVNFDSITNEYGFHTPDSMQSLIGGVTLQNGDVTTGAITLSDNLITTNRSNDNLNITSNGNSQIQIKAAGGDLANYSTSADYTDANAMYYEDLSDTVGDGNKHYNNLMISNLKLTSGQSSSNSSDRWRHQSIINLDLNGSSSTATSGFRSRGPMAFETWCYLDNSSSSAAALGNASAGNQGININPSGTGAVTVTGTTNLGTYLQVKPNSGLVTITDAIAYESFGIAHDGTGTGGLTITDFYHYKAEAHGDNNGNGTLSLTNNYGFYFANNTVGTNNYAFYDASNSLSVFGDIQTQAVSITDNHITTNRSNDDLVLESNGTGYVQISANGGDFSNYSTLSRYNNGNILLYQDLSDTLADDRNYRNVIIQDIKLTAGQSASTSGSDRWRNLSITKLDLNGNSTTTSSASYRSRGPMGLEALAIVSNSGSGAGALGNASGGNYGVALYPGGTGNLTLTGTTGMGTYFEIEQKQGDITITDHVAYESIGIDRYDGTGGTPGNLTITDIYHYRAGANSGSGGGTVTLTNNYAFYAEAETLATNAYAFYDAGASLSRFGAVILANQAGDPSTVTDSAHIYAKDVSSSSEVFVRDEAGNVTQISPHNEQGEWQYWSENIKTGKKVRINMERMIRKLEEITGETFIENE